MTLKFDCYTSIGDREVSEESLLVKKYGGAYLLAAAYGHDAGRGGITLLRL